MSGPRKVVEHRPVPDKRRRGRQELSYRLHQQSVLSEFGNFAMSATSVDDLLNEAARLCAKGMHAHFCKVLEYVPADNRFIVRAGIGWKPGYVGSATLAADTESPAGYSYHTGRPVVSNELESEKRFRIPQILVEHGVRRAINVLVTVAGHRWGVLEADSRDEGEFDKADKTFLQSFAHLLGAAVGREQTAAALRQSEERFRALADSLPHLAWVCDKSGYFSWFNRRWYEFTGTTPEESLGWSWSGLNRLDLEPAMVERFLQALRGSKAWEDTFPLKGADGQTRWFLSRAEPIRDDAGRIVNWVGTNTDVTNQKEAEEMQRTLTREASHRVKNSLSLVSSLLNLQACSLKDEARRALGEAASRVYTIAAVHDQLWRQADTREVDLQQFLTNLCAAITTASPQHKTISDIEPVVVSADLAIQVGLLVNELVTNANKYAYPPGTGGEIRVTGARDGSAHYRISVADAGRGLPKGFDINAPAEGLGMRIVKSLSRKLHADMTAENTRPGARFSLSIPLEGTKPQTAKT